MWWVAERLHLSVIETRLGNDEIPSFQFIGVGTAIGITVLRSVWPERDMPRRVGSVITLFLDVVVVVGRFNAGSTDDDDDGYSSGRPSF